MLISDRLFRAHQQQQRPIIACHLRGPMGYRCYSTEPILLSNIGMIYYTGTARIGDSANQFGSNNLLVDVQPYLLAVSSLRETLAPEQNDLFAGYTGIEFANMTITLNNYLNYFGNILGRESFLSQYVTVLLGYPNITLSEYKTSYTGIIHAETLTETTLELETQAN